MHASTVEEDASAHLTRVFPPNRPVAVLLHLHRLTTHMVGSDRFATVLGVDDNLRDLDGVFNFADFSAQLAQTHKAVLLLLYESPHPFQQHAVSESRDAVRVVPSPKLVCASAVGAVSPAIHKSKHPNILHASSETNRTIRPDHSPTPRFSWKWTQSIHTSLNQPC